MPGRVRVFGAERGAKRVYLAQGQAIGFKVELARYGQKRLMPKKVLAEINLAVFGARKVEQVKIGNSEHLAGAFGVRCGNDGRIDPVIAALIKRSEEHTSELQSRGHLVC